MANISGQQLFRATNLSRYAQGMGRTNTPQPHTTMQNNDTLTSSQLLITTITWNRIPPLPPILYNAIIWYKALNSKPFTINETRRMKMIGSLPIVPNIPLPIDVLFIEQRQIWTGCYIQIAIALTETGGVPFTLLQSGFINLLW